jgi:diketogulonate reductase-like aldo/keto reductase
MSTFSATFRRPAPPDLSDEAQKPWVEPIPGKTKLHRLEENLGAVKVELTPEDLCEIDEVSSEIDVQGARYPEKLEALTGR